MSKAGFWDRHARGYAKSPVKDQAAYERKLKVTQEYLNPTMEVLEFGCGTGTTALIQAPFVSHITAIDVSAKMLAIAKGKAAEAGVQNVDFRVDDIETMALPDRTYDLVMGHSILHLLEDKEAAIRKVHKMLKPGGVFVSSTACLSGSMAWLRFILPIGHWLGLLPLVKFFTVEELVTSMTEAGFSIDYHWQPSPHQGLFLVAKKG